MGPPATRSPSTEVAPLCSVASSGVAFIGACAASQLAQLTLLNVHTGSRWIGGLRVAPSLLGVCTVGAASVASVAVGEAVASALSGDKSKRPDVHASTTALLGAACFLGLGGRFWRLSPSGLADLGALANTARGSLPASLAYANRAEREAIQALGRRFGCHSCGARPLLPLGKSMSFIADHQPPLASVRLANAALWRRIFGLQLSQRFYPQCVTCSGKQAVLLAERSARIKQLGSTRRALQVADSASAAVFHAPSLLRPQYAVGALLEGLAQFAPDAVIAVHDAVHDASAQIAHGVTQSLDRIIGGDPLGGERARDTRSHPRREHT